MVDANAGKMRTPIRNGILPRMNGLRQAEASIRADGFSIRILFRIGIAAISTLVYVAVIGISYARVSADALGQATASVRSEVNYLCLQLESLGQRAEAFQRAVSAAGVSPDAVSEADADDYALLTDPVSDVLKGYTLEETGTVAIARDDVVVSSDDARIPVGEDLRKLLGVQAYSAIGDSLESGQLQNVKLDGALATPGERNGYLLAGTQGDYTIVIVEPAGMVFRDRAVTLRSEGVITFAILAVVFLLVDYLLVISVANHVDAANETLGRIVAGDLDARVPREGTREFRSLAQGINVTVSALKDWIGEAERRMEEDLATARRIQKGALPSDFSSVGNADKLRLYASMDPAREVGGDFYDFFELNDHTIAFLIADVSGKGIPGALFMMSAKTEIENRLREGVSPAEAIASANAYLCANNEAGMFVTVWAATLDWKTGLLTYVNAGHNFPLLRRGKGGSWEWLKKKCGLFLGTFETAKYRQETLTLAPGDELLLYTDGVNEAFNVDDDEYGNDRLERFLALHAGLAPKELVAALRADVASWAVGAEQSDDVTILALELR